MKNIFFLFLLVLSIGKLNAQALETEESKPLLPGQFEIGTGLEYQTSSEGTETALPMAIEYGISKRFTLLIEPVAFTSINPKVGTSAFGVGDLEATLFFQILKEKKILPAISLSTEIKIPTAKNLFIGTGKTDFTPFFIATKTTGKFMTSINLSYTLLGKPTGVIANNLFNYAAGTIFTASPKSILFGEIYGNTSSLFTDAPEGTTTTTTELSGGETVGAIGYGIYLKKEFLLSFGVSYDNNNAILFRPGFEWKFGGKE